MCKISPQGSINEYSIPTASSGPEGITAGADGNLWYVESNANNVAAVTTLGSFLEIAIPTSSSAPFDVTLGPDNLIWFTEHAANQIAIFVPAGADRSSPGHNGFKEFPLPLGGEPAGIAAAADGTLWFAENSGNRIGRIRLRHNGGEAGISEFPLPVPHSHPNGIAIGGDGDVYFTELAASRIGKVTTTSPRKLKTSFWARRRSGTLC